ncbi:MAG: hypothetical protein V3S44_08115 [Alphaproteobacteria bacterium]
MTAFAPESPEPATAGKSREAAPDDPRAAARGALADYFAVSGRRAVGRGYGRFVGLVKILLVGLATGLVVALVIWPQIGKNNSFKLGSMKMNIEQADVDSLRVVNARITGSGSDGLPFTLTFDSASQTRKDADLVALAGPKADVYLRDGSWVALTSPKGRYHRSSRILELDAPVSLFHDSGLEIQTGAINFNLSSGDGAGHDPLHGQGPFGNIDSEGFRIRDGGKIIQFTGKARAVLFAVPGPAG